MKTIKTCAYAFFCAYSVIFGVLTFFLIEEPSFMKYYLIFLCVISAIFYGYNLYKDEL